MSQWKVRRSKDKLIINRLIDNKSMTNRLKKINYWNDKIIKD